MVERATTDQLKREQDQRDRMRWLAEQRTRVQEREKQQKIERDRVCPGVARAPRHRGLGCMA